MKQRPNNDTIASGEGVPVSGKHKLSRNNQAGKSQTVAVEKPALKDEMERLTKQRNELIRLNEIKDEFISLASHQLRTPATAVKQYLQLLINEYAGPISDEQLQYLQITYNSNERQLRIINDLLKTAQIDVGSYKLSKAEHSILDVIDEVVEEIESTLDLKSQKVDVRIKNDTAPKVVFDYREMKLVLINLLDNASKYSFPKTTIKLIVDKGDECLLLSIKDSGVGISKKNLKRIFDKFTRVDNELSDTVNGSGLGLYWVKRIVEIHGGTIKVTSKLKSGSTFTIRLPL